MNLLNHQPDENEINQAIRARMMFTAHHADTPPPSAEARMCFTEAEARMDPEVDSD